MRCEKPDDSWVTLATVAFGPLERDVLDSIARAENSVLLAILNKVALQSIPTGSPLSTSFLDSQPHFVRAYRTRHTQYPSETAA